MLGLFPHPYPDELIYSILARYSVRAGYSQYIFVAEDLFQRRSLRPNFEYLPALKDEVVKELTKNRTLCEVILNHTMFPYYCRFLPIDRKRKAINSLVKMDSNYHDVTLYPKCKESKTMRYCPLCVSKDRNDYGETYWHRIHQINELSICPLHYCYLADTSFIISGKVSPDLIPAEIVIPDNLRINHCENLRLRLFADYVYKVFMLPIKMDNECGAAYAIKLKMENTKYRSPRGGICRITELYSDFAEYYSGVINDLPKQWQIHKVITGQRYDFWEVSMLGFFLNIAPIEFQKAKIFDKKQEDVFDERIKTMRDNGLSYPKIAEIMSASVDTIKNAVYATKKRSKPRARKGVKPGRRPIDWESLDIEMLPKVVDTIDRLRSSERPHRITIGGVARIVGLKSKQIDQLPLCKAEIVKHGQSQEEFWAQKVLWAWEELSKEGRSISIKQIRLRTNMSIEQIRRTMAELASANIEVYEQLSKLL